MSTYMQRKRREKKRFRVFLFNAYRLNTASHNIMKKSDLLDR